VSSCEMYVFVLQASSTSWY